jgi:hypothetical protein
MIHDAIRATLLQPYSHTFVTYDLEFLTDGTMLELVSAGMVSGDGRKLYVVNRELDERKLLTHSDGWMRKNVWPHLPLTDLPEKRAGGNGLYGGEYIKKCRCAPVPGTGAGTGKAAEYSCYCMNGRLDRDHPDVRPIGQIRRLVSDFLMESHPEGVELDRNNIHMWAWYGAYDHVCLVQSLWQNMVDLPAHVPMLTHDLKSEHMRLGSPKIPQQIGTEHNALADAEGNLTKARFMAELVASRKEQ